MKLLDDFRAIIVGFVSGILLSIYTEHQQSIMGMTIIFIVFSSWLMLVIWNQKKQLSANFPLPEWLTGVDLMKHYNISPDQLMQHVQKGLNVYPPGDDVIIIGDEVPPLKNAEFSFMIGDNAFDKLRFKKTDIEKYIKRKNQ